MAEILITPCEKQAFTASYSGIRANCFTKRIFQNATSCPKLESIQAFFTY